MVQTRHSWTYMLFWAAQFTTLSMLFFSGAFAVVKYDVSIPFGDSLYGWSRPQYRCILMVLKPYDLTFCMSSRYTPVPSPYWRLME